MELKSVANRRMIDSRLCGNDGSSEGYRTWVESVEGSFSKASLFVIFTEFLVEPQFALKLIGL